MRKFHLLFYLALLPVVSSAQDRIGYSYDAAGNRVKREIVMPIPKAMAKQQTFAADGQAFTDMLRDHTVKIYPNPTEGALQVSISGLTGTDKCSLGVYTSWKSHTNLTHPGKYFRPSKVKIMRPTSPK